MNEMNNTYTPPTLAQLMVDAAAALENLTDLDTYGDGSGEYSEDQRAGVRLAGWLRDAAAGKPVMRSWDVTVTTIVNVKMPYGVDPSTDAGVDAIKEAIPGKVVDCIDEGAFDISCEEYLDG